MGQCEVERLSPGKSIGGQWADSHTIEALYQCVGPSLVCLVSSRISREVTRTSAVGTPAKDGDNEHTSATD